MTSEAKQIKEYLSSLSDDELRERATGAIKDCQSAAEEDKESEWHQQCFGAVLAYGLEMQRRGMQQQCIQTLH